MLCQECRDQTAYHLMSLELLIETARDGARDPYAHNMCFAAILEALADRLELLDDARMMEQRG